MEWRWGVLTVKLGVESLVAQGLVPQRTIGRFVDYLDANLDQAPGADWYWKGSLASAGYGKFHLGQDVHGNDLGRHSAHHAAYLLFVGPVPEGFDVDHRCHTKECRLAASCPHRACVRPSHLRAVTRGENISRGAGRWGGTACGRGHPWTPESSFIGADGKRRCRICYYARSRESYARRTAGRVPKPHHNATKTHCPRGHEYTPENTIIRANGSRQCRTCQRAANQASKAKRRNRAGGQGH